MNYRDLFLKYMEVVHKITGKTCVYECGEFTILDQEEFNELNSIELQVMESYKNKNYKEIIKSDNLELINDGWKEAYFKLKYNKGT